MKTVYILVFSLLGGALGSILLNTGQHYTANTHATNQSLSANYQAPSRHFVAAESTPINFRVASKKSMAGVVHISTIEEQPLTLFDYYYGRRSQVREGSGSGVIYSANGYIVTNNHVVEGAQSISVSLNDNRKFNASLVGTYPPADLAVLKIEGENLPQLSFANSDLSEVGDWVLAVGNPYNLSSTVTAGIISAKGRDINIINNRNAIESFIQTDAAINPGNSGGALVDDKGDVIGINTAIYSRSGGYSGYGFAIPANLAARIADDIIANGFYRQLVLGIEASELDEAYAKELGINGYRQGIFIESVEANGIADQAGVEIQDLVVQIAGRPVNTIPEFKEAISSQKRGSKVAVTVVRKGKKVNLIFKL